MTKQKGRGERPPAPSNNSMTAIDLSRPVFTYGDLLIGDVVIGHDHQLWGVSGRNGTAVTLSRAGYAVTGHPLPGQHVKVHACVGSAAAAAWWEDPQ